MRKNKTVVIGSAALWVGMLAFTGCNNQVMGQRDYVPASQESQLAPMPGEESAPPRPQVRPRQRPVRDIGYQPMEKVTSSPVTSIPDGTQDSGEVRTHVVKPGETIGRIARQYGVPTGAVMQANDLDEAKAKRIHVGRELKIPAGGAAVENGKGAAPTREGVNSDGTYTVQDNDFPGKIARKLGVKESELMRVNNLTPESAKRLRVGQKLIVPAGATLAGNSAENSGGKGAATIRGSVNSDGTYTVQDNDFPGKIARKLGVKESELMRVNNLTPESAKRLRVGQKLIVPGKGAEASTTVAVETKPAPQEKPVETISVSPAESDPLDDVLSGSSEGQTPTAAPETVETPQQGQSVDPTVPVPEGEDEASLNQIPIIVDEDTTLEAFAAKHKTTADAIRKLNEGAIPADGKLSKNMLLMIPGN